jgi:hypothetical protein
MSQMFDLIDAGIYLLPIALTVMLVSVLTLRAIR